MSFATKKTRASPEFPSLLPIMGYRFISRDVKIAAVRLYERGLLDLEEILDCCGFAHRTWFCVLKLWHETGDVVPVRGRLRIGEKGECQKPS